jgi:hypothetical protein
MESTSLNYNIDSSGICVTLLFCDLQRPLTVKDYLKNSPIGGLTDIVTGVGLGVGACGGAGASRGASVGAGIGVGVGTLTNTVAGTLPVAVAAQPGPRT